MRFRLAVPLLVPALAAAQPRGDAALAPLVDGLGTTARVLVIGAHPDDEDTPLVTYLARGRHARTAYLSVTRGESGNNLTGGEGGIPLGVVRTAESLAASDVDGAERYFTRAFDFGATKSAAEAAEKWSAMEGGDAVLGDVVTVVRALRPQVVITMHSSAVPDLNGQHRAAAQLAVDAFAAASDTMRFPVQQFGRPWTPAKLYRLARVDEPGFDSAATLRVNVGEYAPALGRTWAEIAAEARAREKSQGDAPTPPLGSAWSLLRLVATRVGEGAPASERSVFDGVDTTLARLRRPTVGGELLAAMDSLPVAIARVQSAYRRGDPSSAVPPLAALVELSARAAAFAGTTMRGWVYDADLARSLEDVWRRAREALVVASGVAVEATADRELVARRTESDTTDTLRVAVAVHNRGTSEVRVGLAAMTGGPNIAISPNARVAPDSVWRGTIALTPRFVTQPWWTAGGLLGMLYAANVDGHTEREWEQTNESGALVVLVRMRIAGGEAAVVVPVKYRARETSKLAERPVAVVPGITVRLDNSVQYARAGAPLVRPLRVTLQSGYTTARDVRVTVKLPRGLTTDSAARTVTLPAGATGVVSYVVRGVPRDTTYEIDATAQVGAESFALGSGTLSSEHVPPQRLYFDAKTVIHGVDVVVPAGTLVGYVGAPGDRVPTMLAQLGVQVAQLDPASFALAGAAGLARYTAIVVGPRVYETMPALLSANGLLYDFARRGGTVVVQYGQYLMEQPGVLPYAISLGRPAQSVTREESPVRVLDGSAPVLSLPNRIRQQDFASWVQDRALFVPSSFDAHWKPVLEVGDPDEAPTRGALLVAPLGRGTYVYTTLSLFRQLAAAHPGAARLFVNLIAAPPPTRR